MTNPRSEVLKERDLRAALTALGDISDAACTAIDFAKPSLPALAAYYKRLCERPGFQKHGCNGMP